MNPCTEKQAACLQRNGYDPSEYSFDDASTLIDALKANNWQPLTEPGAPKPTAAAGTAVATKPAVRKAPAKQLPPPSNDGPCTVKQAAVLDKYGYVSEGVSFNDAKELIDRIAANNWQPLED